MALRFTVPLPPTDNNIYIPVRSGKEGGHSRMRMRLSGAARAYKLKVAQVMSDIALLNPTFALEDDIEYVITLVVYFRHTHNKGWPDKSKARFRKVDSHNRVKLVVDAVTDGLGLDDSCLFEQHIIKQEDFHNPRVEVELRRWIWR